MNVNIFSHTWYLTGRIIVLLQLNITLVKLNKLTSVSSDCQTAVRLHKTMNGNCTLFSCCNGINGKFRSCVNVTAYKDIRFCCLIRFLCLIQPLSLLINYPRQCSVRYLKRLFHKERSWLRLHQISVQSVCFHQRQKDIS